MSNYMLLVLAGMCKTWASPCSGKARSPRITRFSIRDGSPCWWRPRRRTKRAKFL